MQFRYTALLLCAAMAASSSAMRAAAPVPSANCSDMSIGASAGLNGLVPFLTTDPWQSNISRASVDPNSAALIAQLGGSKLHPDFGAGTYNGSTMGIPYTVVSGQRIVPIRYQAYGAQSDPGGMPIPASARVEGYPSNADGDRHVLVLDRDTCFLYELFNAYLQGDGSWNAASGTIWDLLNNTDRPYQWTSADAAGLPIFPGLARYDEVAAGEIKHALRFTVQNSRAAYLPPATHYASSSTASNRLPMGARLRLKANYDISGFTPQTKVILTALKNYGMILADNGSNMYISGTTDDRWDNDDLHALGQVPASAFEVIRMGTPITSSTIPKGSAPAINSFTATRAAGVKPTAGSPVVLKWGQTNASSVIVSPSVGPVRGNTVTVKPAITTTYTIYATNHFGRTTKTVTVTVQ